MRLEFKVNITSRMDLNKCLVIVLCYFKRQTMRFGFCVTLENWKLDQL